MSDKEEETILETPKNEEVLADLDKEQPKPLLLLIAVILGSLSLILSLVAIMQTKEDSSAGPRIEQTPVDGGVGLENVLARLEALEQKSAQLSAVPSEFNAESNPALEHEVTALRNELESLRAKVDNLRIGIATNSSGTNTGSVSTPPPPPPPTSPPPATLTVPPGGKLHILKSGETLTALSKMYGVTLTKIQAANQGLDPRKLQVGAKIIIPAP
jgi:LysM repeat protein